MLNLLLPLVHSTHYKFWDKAWALSCCSAHAEEHVLSNTTGLCGKKSMCCCDFFFSASTGSECKSGNILTLSTAAVEVTQHLGAVWTI